MYYGTPQSMINKEQLKTKIEKLQQKGHSFRSACEVLNIPRSTAWDYINDRKRSVSTSNMKCFKTTIVKDFNSPPLPSIFVKDREIQQKEENYENISSTKAAQSL